MAMAYDKVVMKSGRVYKVPNVDSNDYRAGWMYFDNSNGETVLGLRKENIEAKMKTDFAEGIDTNHTNSN